MQQILKRLELIKTAISIEDEEIIDLQVLKLQKLEIDAQVAEILAKITQKDYSSVMQKIEDYLEQCSGLVVYEDKELQGLRLELKALERKLQELSAERDEYLGEIHDFNLQYHLRLGKVIQNILQLKESLLQSAMQEKKEAFEKLNEAYQEKKKAFDEQKQKVNNLENELENMDEFDEGYDELYEELKEYREALAEEEERLNETRKETKKAKETYEEDDATKEYEEAKEDSESFNKEYEEAKDEEQIDISEEEKKELKIVYRKASRLCHPDLVSEELKEQAHAMMQKLNDAYNKHDLKAVKEMLVLLESGRGFDIASDSINNTKQLKEKIVDVRVHIQETEEELDEIEEDEVFKILQEYDDVDEYLDAMKEELQKEYARLCDKEEEQVTQTHEVLDEDEYWDTAF